MKKNYTRPFFKNVVVYLEDSISVASISRITSNSFEADNKGVLIESIDESMDIEDYAYDLDNQY